MMKKTDARKVMERVAQHGYFAVGHREAWMRCPECGANVQGLLPRYAGMYGEGRTYMDDMVLHLMGEDQ